MLLEEVQPPLQTDLFLQGAMEILHWTLHIMPCDCCQIDAASTPSLLHAGGASACQLITAFSATNSVTADLCVRKLEQVSQLVALPLHSTLPCST